MLKGFQKISRNRRIDVITSRLDYAV